jgi:plasmid maintenance system antidote protein VapI
MKSRSEAPKLKMKATLRPFRAIKPGEILEEELDARGWSPSDFADRIGRCTHEINEIIAGKNTIGLALAVAFSGALGTSAQYWSNLESAYRLDCA